ncbi:MAG: FG-GAP-like repeat-containing protein [Desulfobacter sp.]
MNSNISATPKWITHIFIFFFIFAPAFAVAEQAPVEPAGDAVIDQIEQVEQELTDQGLLENSDGEAEEESPDEETAPESLEKTSGLKAESSMMAATATVENPYPPSLEDVVFDVGLTMPELDVSMKVGAATMTYPIQVPLGRNHLTPNVSLNYNSSRNHGSSRKKGVAGAGWSLNTPSIARSLKRGACYTCTDFTYNGEDLAPVSTDSNGYGTYRPEKEQDFSIIEFNPDNSWTVTLKTGMVYRFGSSAAHRQTNAYGTSQWLLHTITDTNGNTLSYTYTFDQGQPYLSSITYSDYYTLSFYYETRPDSIVDIASSVKIVTALRLKTIALASATDHILAYALSYGISDNTGQSLLTRIRRYGADFGLDSEHTIVSGTSLPDTTMSYTHEKNILVRSLSPLQDFTLDQGYEQTLEFPVVKGDWNGDGKTDLGRVGPNTMKFYTSTGTELAFMTSLSDFTRAHSYTNTDSHPLVIGDWDGDGKTDIGRVDQSRVGFYKSTGSGWQVYTPLNDFSPAQFYTDQKNRPIFTGDWNGDGKTDIGRADTNGIRFYTSTGTGWQEYPGTQATPDEAGDVSIFTGDWNGDGRTDFARVIEHYIKFFVSTGSGFSHYCSLPDMGSEQYDNYVHPLITGDFNGDGLSDVGRSTDDRIKTYLSTGIGFVPGGEIVHDMSRLYGFINQYENPLFTGDFNNDGLTDIGGIRSNSFAIYTSTGTGFSIYSDGIMDLGKYQTFENNYEYPLVTGDFTGDGRTGIARAGKTWFVFYAAQGTGNDLMSQATATAGNTTSLEYKLSSDYPDNLNLPKILPSVSKITTEDGLGNTSETTYAYSGGLYDYTDREIRSFAAVTKTNPDKTRHTSHFHQGNFLDGKAKKTEVLAEDGTLLTRTDYTWESTPYNSDSAFIRLVEQKETLFENGKTVFHQDTYTHNNTHGSVETHTVSGSTLSENITTAYTYDYFGTGLTYPLRTTRQTLTGSVSGLTRDSGYTYEPVTGNLLTQTSVNDQGDDPVTTYGYDSYGNVAFVTDPRGNTANYDYDTTVYTWPVRTELPFTNGVAHVVEYPSVDYRFGKPLAFVNQNNFQTTYEYDVFGRVTRINYPDGGEEQYIRDDVSMPRSVIRRVKETESSFIDTTTFTDGYGRTIQTLAKSKDQYTVSLFTFDHMGREECIKGPFFTPSTTFLSAEFSQIASDPSTVSSGATTTWLRHFYDNRSRIIQTQQSGDLTTYFTHENFETRITDPDGHSKTQVLDSLGRVVRVVEHGPASDHIVTYTYTPADDLVKISRDNPATGSPVENLITYDTLGRKIAMTDPDMGHWTYGYDPNGNLASQTDAGNTTLTFTYDELNRKIQKNYPDGSSATWAYDGATNGTGLIHETSNANATTTYTAYDETGRPLSETRVIDAETVRFDYTYDLSGRNASKAVTRNDILFNTFFYEFYAGTSLLARVKNGENNALTEVTQYTPQGKIEFFNHFNGTMANYIYDYATSRLSVIHSYNMSQDIMDKNFTYTKAGDIKTITDNRINITRTYEYDHLHRLVSELSSGTGVVAGTSVEVIEFNYEDTPGPPVHAPSQTRTNGTLTEYTYTATGNRSYKNDGFQGTTYESNADNMISKITIDGTETEFFYDADNKRVRKTQGLSATLYFGDRFEIINGTPTLYVFAGNLRVAQVTDSDLAYFHKDHLGSTSAMSRQDGTVIDFGEYLPYGQDRSTNGLLNFSPYKFTDQEQDQGTGLYNYDARLYDPLIGQFVMADTIVPERYNPQSLNRYAYCLNNPLIYTDPTGHLPGGVLGTRGTGEQSNLGFNGEDGFFGSKSSLMGVLSYGIPGLEAYAGWHDDLCDKLGLESTFSKTISNIAVVSAPVFAIIDLVEDVFNLGQEDMVENQYTSEYCAIDTKEYAETLNEISRGIFDSGPQPGSMREALNEIDKVDSANSEGAEGASIICTELYKQGLMRREIYKADSIFGAYIKKYNPEVMIGYQFLCGPLVQLMKKSKIVTNIVNVFAMPWSHEMAFQIGFKKEGHILGKMIMDIGIPVCRLTGMVIANPVITFHVSGFMLLCFFLFLRRTKSCQTVY